LSGTNCTAVPPAVWNFNPARLRPRINHSSQSWTLLLKVNKMYHHNPLARSVNKILGDRGDSICNLVQILPGTTS